MQLLVSWFSLLNRHYCIVLTMANRNFQYFRIVVLFHFFGIAPLINSSKWKNFLYLIYQCASIATVLLMLFYKQQIISKLYDVTSQVTLRILLISHVVSIVEAMTTKDRQLKIMKQLNRIDAIISEEFCTESENYNRLKTRYTWYVWGVFLGIFVVRTLHSIVFNRAPLVVCCVWAYAHYGIGMRLLQNAFYVDMIYERLHILHGELNKLENDSCKVQQQLNLAGDLYGKLWMMTNDINFSFGWSLMAIIVECIVDIVNEANILYFYCDDECFYTTMRKCLSTVLMSMLYSLGCSHLCRNFDFHTSNHFSFAPVITIL